MRSEADSIGLPQRITHGRMVDDLAVIGAADFGGTGAAMRPRLYCHTPRSSVHMTTRACDGSRLN
jgi:hypothetical protein